MEEQKKYKYDGPVYNYFGDWMGNFNGFTTAKTKAQALRNLSYRAKLVYHLMPSAHLRLESVCLEEVEWPDKEEPFHQISLFELENFNV